MTNEKACIASKNMSLDIKNCCCTNGFNGACRTMDGAE